ncbi:bifunctional 4-hydroxy-2-oxoglutarate aldolase/2-dehydro-3-deoxy-phosphogluconate aldolase [Leucobacter luti]|uniref:2-dehydro-3-deoxyphosphogluconate aldolase/(4S)-4-hydroxy-2-oxoglutarate aldolase n=1 Tax=Leucobacter luti TaxID=340320 RepID=A0A4R6S3S4_9MICO|nr:bifunctional 4-hydroxy-2-oxoglutarate aldolase/2-dehydro-3-deoxy-phosphogluconate aldolase [Leucobacter luti]QYM74959.1 bifunctional 4-hydroxy-2-oxoglutarate aldolase/2-dehydro-3-deoxy-phosphogluconate aldolase [Leucobacter luti]TDP93366.1 2-dehydro-3-deoxyphosphogluconate aldolase/(4S)-4-hydroxy-2-oxoglutarate aldolase [Leucobacter luti]
MTASTAHLVRSRVPAALQASPVIAVLRASHADAYAPVVEALLSGGVRHVEVTLSTPGTLAAVPALTRRFGADAAVGVGTITTVAEARAAAQGSAFLVTPTTQPEVIAAGLEAGLPVFPGGFTPTELHAGWAAGATAVKVFPASHLGPGYVADLRGPFPDIQVVPSGGVTIDGALDWLRAGACAVSLGGPLLQDVFRGGSLDALTARARELVTRIADAGLSERGSA